MGCQGCDDNNCSTDYGSLPVLTDCPSDNETILVGGATGGHGSGGYARRTWGKMVSCISIGDKWYKLTFKIGDVGCPMTAGDTSLIITIANPIEDSEIVTMDGSLLVPQQYDRVSYTPIFTSTDITINFNQGVENGQLYYIKYQTR